MLLHAVIQSHGRQTTRQTTIHPYIHDQKAEIVSPSDSWFARESECVW